MEKAIFQIVDFATLSKYQNRKIYLSYIITSLKVHEDKENNVEKHERNKKDVYY